MVRQIHVTLAAEDTGLISIAKEILAEYGVSPTELSGVRDGADICLLLFCLTTRRSGQALDRLAEHGIGSGRMGARGTVEVLELRSATHARPRRVASAQTDAAWLKFFRVTDRASVDEIFHKVDASYHLTFDYICCVMIAAVVCAVGLIARESIYVTASMLISPLMGPIQASVVGLVIRDRSMFIKGFRNEAIGVLVCICVGMCVGVVCLLVGGDINDEVTDPAFEALHYKPSDLALGACIALPSGFALALGVCTTLSETIVGVAIATSLLPPVVASGINLCIALQLLVASARHAPSNITQAAAYAERWDAATHDVATTKLIDAGFGMAMLAINWILIMLGCGLLLRLKQVGPTLLQDWQITQGEPLPRARLLEPAEPGSGAPGRASRLGSEATVAAAHPLEQSLLSHMARERTPSATLPRSGAGLHGERAYGPPPPPYNRLSGCEAPEDAADDDDDDDDPSGDIAASEPGS